MTIRARAAALALAAALAAGCSSADPEPEEYPPAPSEPPTIEELRAATYSGFGATRQPLTLAEGKWEHAADRIAITFARDFRITGDLDGSPPDEAVVIITESRGGTGSMPYLAVVSRRDGKLVNVATTPLGDRVQLRDVRIANRRIVTEVLRAGPGDAMCCPGELASRTWELAGATLRELPAAAPASRLSLDAIAGPVWVLRSWDLDESAPVAPEITLQYKDGRISGTAGCSNYFAAIKERGSPGEVVVSPPGATKKACADEVAAIAERYLQLIGSVNHYGFMLGQLMLSYRHEGRTGGMLYERR